MKNKKIITMISAIVMAFSCVNIPVYAVNSTSTETITEITAENSQQLWERFLKYDLCILDYDSLTDEQKELCKFIFETELNSEDTIICERARRIIAGYDVGRRATLEDTENYYDFGDPAFLYQHVLSDTPYFYTVPDIKHVDLNYNEYWLDESGMQKILSNGEIYSSKNDRFLDNYEYIEQDENDNIITNRKIKRYSIHFKTVEDENFIYVVYPDNTLYLSERKMDTAYPVVPEEVNGMKVVGIKSDAFLNGLLDTIELPDTIEYIEPLAFDNCRYLKSVNIPENLKYLGAGAFLCCQSLENISIDCPNLITVKSAFEGATIDNLFINVKSLSSILLKGTEKINNITFGDDVIKMGTVWANSQLMKDYNYTIPESVKSITNDFSWFYNECYSDDLIVPETVKVFNAYSVPAISQYEADLISIDSGMSVVNNKCYLSPDTIISGYYGTEAHDYALSHNLKFNPLDDLTYGDANNDGSINIADAVSLQKYLFGNGSVGYEADLTKDGIIDSFDMIYMRKMILNQQ